MTRGHDAESPVAIPARGWKDIAFRVKDQVRLDHVGLIAAGVAFYGLMAIFPAITATMALGGLLVDPPEIVQMIAALKGVVPAEVLTIITKQATAVAGSESGGLGLTVVLGILLAIYSSSKGVGSLIEAMNVAYNEKEERGFFVLTLIKLGLTLLLILSVIFGAALAGGIPIFLAFADVPAVVGAVLPVFGILVLIACVMVGLSAFYRLAPSRSNAEWRWITPGAIVACTIWIFASAGFAFYVGNFGSYNETFGTMTGIIVMLMWIWISAFIIILGAELNSEIEAQTARDTSA